MIGEPLAPVGSLVEAVLLDGRTHRAVENDDAFTQELFERMKGCVSWHGVSNKRHFHPFHKRQMHAS